MAETPETNKPVLRNGFPIRDLGDGSIISGQANGEELVLSAEAMNPLPLAHCPLAEGLNRGRHRALSLASCMFQSPEWRGAARTGFCNPCGGCLAQALSTWKLPHCYAPAEFT